MIMAQMRVIIRDHTGSKKTLVELPEDIPMRRLLPALVTRMNLPTNQGGQLIGYVLDYVQAGRRLRDEDTLATAGVNGEEVLTLLPQITAGAPLPPRLRRLSSDYGRLGTLEAQSDLFQTDSSVGDPPEQYRLLLRCRGIERLVGSEPVYRDEHVVEIELPAGYPRTRPNVYFKTPIFHPNIQDRQQGGVCLGTWYASMWLDELVMILIEMVQYRIPPTTTSFDALNLDAVHWLRKNLDQMPVDPRPIFRHPQTVLSNNTERGKGKDSNIHISESIRLLD
jgi:ubiquitin-protein ligase